MDKIDLIITGIIVAVMIVCFCLGTQWSYFCAGICATCIFIVNIGRIAHISGQKQQDKQWEKFMDSLDTTHPVAVK